MQPAAFYTAAREFLARARPTPDPTTYKRRVQGIGQLLPAGLPSPGTRLRPSPSSFEVGVGAGFGMMGSGTGDEIDDAAQYVRTCMSFNFNSVTDASFCGSLTPKVGTSLDCGPGTVGGVILLQGEWGVNMVSPGYGEAYYNATTYKHGIFSTAIRNPMTAMVYAGIWVEGPEPGQGFAAVIDPGGNVTVFDQGGAIDGASTTFVDGAALSIHTPGIDGNDAIVQYNGAALYIADGMILPQVGRVGIYGFGKGWVQTLQIVDLRCSSPSA